VSEGKQSPWGEVTFEAGDCRCWQVGPLRFWVRRTPAEWQVAQKETDGEELRVAAAEPAPPDDAEWTRWASDPSLLSLRLSPVTPDRSVVVRPEQAFRVLQHGSARIYISVPVWVRIELLTDSGPLRIVDLPTVRLSNTWFGSLFEGELCYWLATSARRNIEHRVPPPHIATASMLIRNQAGDELPLETVSLATVGLSIYEDDRGLWTSEVRVTSASEKEPQRIEVPDGPPPEAQEAKRIAGPREQAKAGMVARAVGLLQALPSAGQMIAR
jgi:hypothetical protein